MKPTKLEDVLDDKLGNDLVVAKMNLLLAAIEATNPNIDLFELRWVEKKIEEYSGGIVPTKPELEKANEIYKVFKKS